MLGQPLLCPLGLLVLESNPRRSGPQTQHYLLSLRQTRGSEHGASLIPELMRTRTEVDLETIQRQAQLCRIGRDLQACAAAISQETVDAMAAVVSRLAVSTGYGKLVEEGFGEGMMSDAAVRHLDT